MRAVLIDEGSPRDTSSIPLATKKGRWIANTRLRERAPESLRAAEHIWHEKFPRLVTRSLSATYNCFGLVFASRRTAITDPSELARILADDGYQKVVRRADISVGDIVIYRDGPEQEPNHAGVIVNVRMVPAIAEYGILVMSQWGLDGEYIHPEEDVPHVYGKYREYYTERRVH